MEPGVPDRAPRQFGRMFDIGNQPAEAHGISVCARERKDVPMMQDTAAEAMLRDTSKLWVEAGSVIALRSVRISLGDPESGDEMVRMVTEKMWAGLELGVALATGRLGYDPGTVYRRTVKHYRRAVRGNLRRLSAND